MTVLATPLLHALFRPILCDYQVVLLAFNALVLLVAPPDPMSNLSRVIPWTVALSITAGEVVLPLAGSHFGERATGMGFYFVAPVVTGIAVACTARLVGHAALTTAVLAGPPLLSPLLPDMGLNHRALILLPVVLFTAGYTIAFPVVRITARIAKRPDQLHH
ncbi:MULTISPECIES: hypothetical protein [unclassified Kitasatospora]|uniref:hypothetical protein n=1 Tax=unclassified Kitasatospora TaxID=2633591 RepID=UPI00340EEC29